MTALGPPTRTGQVRELIEFVRFASVSAQPERTDDVRRCAAWLANQLERIGLERVRVAPSQGHPYVLAEWRQARGQPTVLIYGHYDVVPADTGAWRTPPFEPSVRGEHLYGRGASDDKGPLLAHLKALEHLLCTTGRLPLNVILLCDGEEEIGSPSLKGFLERHREGLGADVAVVSDTRMLGPTQPTIVCGLRGSLSLELVVEGPARELHAGSFGGAIHNPAQVLSEIIAGLHDSQGRVRLPGFYDRVRHVGRQARTRAARSAPSASSLYADAGVPRGWGEAGFTVFERTTIRPALVVTGLHGGYAGPGNKSIIPSRAGAKLNVRLVPDQDPLEVERSLRTRLAHVTPATVRSSLTRFSSARPVTVNTDHPAVHAARVALERSFGNPPALLRSGGTIPVVNLIQDILGLETVLMGFALPDDGMHSVNERFHLPTFFRAIEACARLYTELARTGARVGSRQRREFALEG